MLRIVPPELGWRFDARATWRALPVGLGDPVKLADVDAGTTAFLRCAIAVVVLAPLALLEVIKTRVMSPRGRWLAAAAGVALGVDYIAWTASIYDVGAGVSTVLINVQVIVLPALALLFDREAPPRRFLVAVPAMLVGIGLVGGVSTEHLTGNAARGTLLGVLAGSGYGAYLYLTRRGDRHDPGALLQPLLISTAVAAITAAALAPLSTGLHLSTISSSAWLLLTALAVLGQVIAWLLIHHGSFRLPPSTTAGLLLVQPVLALVLSTIVLTESPSIVQWLGAAVVIAAVGAANNALTTA